MRPRCFTEGHRCKKCMGKCSVEAGITLTELAISEGYYILDEYINSKVWLQAICPMGHLIFIHPNRFKNGSRCLECANNNPNKIHNKLNVLLEREGYTMCTQYINCCTKVCLKCPLFHDYHVRPSNFLAGTRCTSCPRSMSIGEQKVNDILQRLNINFKREQNFPFLPNRYYDFYFVYNNNHYIIEFDGAQHFKYVPFFHLDLDGFSHQQQNDINKTFTAIHHDYKFIRISYKEMNDIEIHIINAINLNRSLYVSNENLYQYIVDCSNQD